MGYTRNVVSGFSWQTVLKIVTNVITLVKIMILARLLAVEEFGLFSLVMIALGLTESFTQTGVNVTIIQSKHSIEYFIDTAWVIAIVRGMLIAVLTLVLGVGMSHFFQSSELLFLIGLVSLVPFIKGFINPAIISPYKELAFFKDTLYRFSLSLTDSIVSIVLVWMVGTVAGWVAALVLTAVFEVVISFVFFRLRPRFLYIPSRAALIYANAKSIATASVLNYLNDNADNLLIGKMAGTYGLGLYQNTYALSHELNYEVTKSAHHGTFPVYTKIVDDKLRLRRAFLKTLLFTTFLSLALSSPLLFFPQFFIPLIFSAKWIPAIPLVPWLVMAGLIHSFALMCYGPLVAKNHLLPVNVHSFLSFVFMIGGIWWGGQYWGLVGSVIGLCISRLMALPYLLWSTWHEVV
ncbi:MAG TPA: oligosaccharide flippase family protein [Vitreimonas sp.]|nr:oligosaccharide flippase family protein [Vitreimonas sp.]